MRTRNQRNNKRPKRIARASNPTSPRKRVVSQDAALASSSRQRSEEAEFPTELYQSVDVRAAGRSGNSSTPEPPLKRRALLSDTPQ